MLQQSYHFEVKDLIASFIDAFDGTVIKRFNQNRDAEKEIKVRYLYAPKQRVLFDIVTPGQNLTLPVVAVTITGLTRDESRVFNKIAGFYVPQGDAETRKNALTNYFRTPVPIDIGINMSILTRYQSDMDQILSNFIPFNNPYIIISWKIPSNLLENTQEIRSEILWSGSVNVSYPTDINASEKYKIVGDTSFTIKGWMFQVKQNDIGNIFQIDSNFSAERSVPLYDNVMQMASLFTAPSSLEVQQTETVSISASPIITDVVYSISPWVTAG